MAFAKETPNLDTTNQSPILEEEEFKIKLQKKCFSN
jgi:RNA polymerase sigma-70 factor (ECF subfamily)